MPFPVARMSTHFNIALLLSKTCSVRSEILVEEYEGLCFRAVGAALIHQTRHLLNLYVPKNAQMLCTYGTHCLLIFCYQYLTPTGLIKKICQQSHVADRCSNYSLQL